MNAPWVVLPLEPTEAMMDAALRAQQSASSPVIEAIYRAVLGAAPTTDMVVVVFTRDEAEALDIKLREAMK